MNNIAFRLKDAYFSYTGKREDAVLRIDHLDIPRGKVVFILGASGLGKSTLLEGLGLMNNTLCAGQMEFLNQKGNTLEMGKAWADERKLFQIRKEYFSFIFQNTNLMENFSAYENISLPVMIQSDTGQLKAYESAERYMREVGLPVDMVGFEKKSSALSGGQRQRLSFVRALNAEFEVLFCDEPTGNLDQFNARELFQIIRRSIGPEQTAIIVSHDIDLALTYADVILCLSKKDGIGVLEPQHTFLPDATNREKVREVILELYASRMVVRKEATQIPSDLQKRLGKARFRKPVPTPGGGLHQRKEMDESVDSDSHFYGNLSGHRVFQRQHSLPPGKNEQSLCAVDNHSDSLLPRAAICRFPGPGIPHRAGPWRIRDQEHLRLLCFQRNFCSKAKRG
jgi:putative ABC transport system ATP-binding protein